MTRLFSSKINILKVFQIEPWSGEIHQGNLEVSNKQQQQQQQQQQVTDHNGTIVFFFIIIIMFSFVYLQHLY